jgi:hypothetical protein
MKQAGCRHLPVSGATSWWAWWRNAWWTSAGSEEIRWLTRPSLHPPVREGISRPHRPRPSRAPANVAARVVHGTRLGLTWWRRATGARSSAGAAWNAQDVLEARVSTSLRARGRRAGGGLPAAAAAVPALDVRELAASGGLAARRNAAWYSVRKRQTHARRWRSAPARVHPVPSRGLAQRGASAIVAGYEVMRVTAHAGGDGRSARPRGEAASVGPAARRALRWAPCDAGHRRMDRAGIA